MDKITFCIPSKSNLRYLKTCIPSIRNNAYRIDHNIIIFVDEDLDGTIDWLESVKDTYNLSYFVNHNLNELPYGIGKAYDYCIDMADTEIFIIFHADMILGKFADYEAWKHLKSKTVVSCTRVEPPLHPNHGEKIIENLGIWPEEFKSKEFNVLVEDIQNDKDSQKTTSGIFAPWMMYKSEYKEILHGHDYKLKSCREDSDLFNRMKLNGFKFIQVWNSLVYHFTGRGAGSFSGDTSRHEAWQREMLSSTREFLRKWGEPVNHNNLMEPIISTRRYKDFILINSENKPNLLRMLEPLCDRIFVHGGLIDNYIQQERLQTSYDLSTRVLDVDTADGYDANDILVVVDCNKITADDLNTLHNLQQIIDSNWPLQVGSKYDYGNLEIYINSDCDRTSDLLKL